ncbi:MAG: hypothetical protein EON91_02610 [Brevundimonas sp.]|uniref:hypothetical protein n=1 Tax=Brevundimonas sp. TaxID=1871086 RepID=UPI001208057A|nr:hypothetical protein [Brevundimonas sp.]RZJ19105.1 MAG: hypothetical protein EON91_02610 [Brevundimonas sp.]
MTAAHAAVALVAASKIVGIAPDRVFEHGGGRARQIAAAAFITGLNVRPADAARLLKLSRGKVAPSSLDRARVSDDQVALVMQDLAAAGLALPPEGPSAPLSPAAETATDQHKAGADREDGGADSPAPVAARAFGVAPPLTEPPRRRPRPTNPVRTGTVRLKPVTAPIARWSRAYVARGVPVDDLAELFDVSPEALEVAISDGGRQAA